MDTHFCFFVTIRTDLLKPKERDVIDRSDELAFSAVSIWEARLKWNSRYASGERKGPVDPAELLEALTLRDIPALGISPALAAISLVRPLAHRDPFDELLLIQAQEGGYRLLTRDEPLGHHPLALIA